MATRAGKNTSTTRKSTRQRKTSAKPKSAAKQKTTGGPKTPAKRSEPGEKNATKKQEDAAMATQDDSLLHDRRRTYEGFTKFMAYSAAGTAIVLILLAILLL